MAQAGKLLLNSAIVILLAIAGFFFVRGAIYFAKPDSLWVAPPSPSSLQGPVARVDINLPGGFDPFHRDIVSTRNADPGLSAPETRLSLTLVGRRFGEDPTAVIRTPDGQQDIYRPEDEIMSGVTLEAVFADYVLIRQSGQTERLTFKREDSGLRRAPELEAPEPHLSMGQPDIFAQLRFTPVIMAGQLSGFRIETDAPPVALSPYNLAVGDVITGVNGRDLTNPNINPQALATEFANASRLVLDIRRDGQTRQVTINR